MAKRWRWSPTSWRAMRTTANCCSHAPPYCSIGAHPRGARGISPGRSQRAGTTALYLNLAWSCHLLRLSETAEFYARKAIDIDPSAVAAHFGLGTILQRLKRYPAAMASYERALKLAPDNALAAAGIAHCKLEQHEYVPAEEWMRRALALAPERPQFWTNLGVALANQERYAEAFEALGHAGQLESAQGAPPESNVDYGFALILTGQDDAAARLYRSTLPELPDARAHGHYALALLMLGQFREGWEQYESRWLQDPHLSHRPNYSQPVWAGQNLEGKTILLRAEQGAGDIIQFARYAVPLKAQGACVLCRFVPRSDSSHWDLRESIKCLRPRCRRRPLTITFT